MASLKDMTIAALLAMPAAVSAAAPAGDDVEPSVVVAERSDTTVDGSVMTAYEKILSKESARADGLMNIHKVKSAYYLEIPDSLMGRPMLLATRVSCISDNSDVIAGQMPRDPLLLEWSRDDSEVYLLDAGQGAMCDTSETIYKGFARNNMKPVMSVFPIKAFGPDSASVLIDVSRFFCDDEGYMSPFLEPAASFARRGGKPLKGSFRPEMSSILSFKAFPGNIVFKTRMVYTVDEKPFTAVVTVSMIRLPDEPMMPRLYDYRVGYFTDRLVRYTENSDRSETVRYINRWRLRPKPEDMDRYLAGETVEPEKPIVYYIDDAFPEKWKKYIRMGVEDWQQAFEKIGFRNAIVARDYPDDPDFDPDDIRYSCIRYASTRVANAMGPSWTDPRSGEIIQGSVYFYHDVLKLLHNWRFVQTAAVDPKAREKVFGMDVMGPMLRYVIVHEVGHTLGLKHNMRGSFAYPVDSLRSPSFTSRYGTTASVMDYARCNYVAQPGDGVEWLVPPVLGPYDFYAVKWGYKPVPGAVTPEDELPVLGKWIAEKSGDPAYSYGEQEFYTASDPASQTESLGDDAVLAGKYGISNLRILMSHLVEWTAEEGKDYSYTKEIYNEVLRQFGRYLGHCTAYIGGSFRQYPVCGDGKPASVPVSREKQKEALDFVMVQLRNLPEWMLAPEIMTVMEPGNDIVGDFQASWIRKLLERSVRVGSTAGFSDKPYTQYEYLNDLFEAVFSETLSGKKADRSAMNMQYAFVHSIFDRLGYLGRSSSRGIYADDPCDGGMLPCSTMEWHENLQEDRAMTSSSGRSGLAVEGDEICFGIITRLRGLLDKRLERSKGAMHSHYYYLLNEIDTVLGCPYAARDL